MKQKRLRQGLIRRGMLAGWGLLLAAIVTAAHAQVVINEIHHNPDVKTEQVEFVELYNAGTRAVSLAGWQLSKGVDYKIAAGVTLGAGGYLVVAQDPAAVVKKFGLAAAGVVGPFQGKLDNEGDTLELRDGSGAMVDQVDYALGFPWPTVGDPLTTGQSGTGGSIQLVNAGLDNNLGGSWRSARPTPGARNSVFAANIPPQIRQVQHEPGQPRAGQAVTISAKVTDPDGVASVALLYQIVNPGAYIARADRAYASNWVQVAMNDAGRDGDLFVGDGVYAAQLPAALQVHRRLIRYRIRATDRGGRVLTVPYPDDPQPNFAWFVYNGAPAWVGSWRPGVVATKVFTAETMNSLPIIQLITKKTTTERCTWLDQDYDEKYTYRGALVYDGRVYDHITYRARGGARRYALGKNFWKVDLNRGHELEVRDDYGKKFKTSRSQLNLGSLIQNGGHTSRGEQGMYESTAFRLFNMVGVAGCRTSLVQLRIIDEASEDGLLNAAHPPLTSRGTQYDGDFWGLYLTVEEPGGRFLDEHDLPDGNLYKMESGVGDQKNQSPTGATNQSDLKAFMKGYMARPGASWWSDNVDLTGYFSYRSIVEALHHYDIDKGNNGMYFLNPQTGRWSVLPWDVNETWSNDTSGDGEEHFKAYGLLDQSSLKLKYQNRLREIRDLLFNPDQAGQLIDETSAFVYTPGTQSIVEADRAMWDYHWVMSDKAWREGYLEEAGRAGQGKFYQSAPTKDFPGMLKLMKDWVASRGAWIDAQIIKDSNIPMTPSVTRDCPSTYPSDGLRFRTSAFSDPNGASTFAALQWRLAEVSPPGRPAGRPTEPLKYEIQAVWQSGEITSFAPGITIPVSAVQVGHRYRVRVRMKDKTGRWSHWSAPLQFVAGIPVNTGPRDYLRITEVMFHPLPAAAGSPYREEDYEYLEVKNTGPAAIDLGGVRLTDGVTGVIAAGTTLQPAACGVLVRNSSAFRQRYGAAARILGQYSGELDNGGERLRLADAADETIVEFTYGDGRGWPLAADGGGHSLVAQTDALAGHGKRLDYGGAWRPSAFIQGSPGRDDPAPAGGVVISEIMAHTHAASPGGSNDWIEIYNPTAKPITLDPYYLSDNVSVPRKWKIPKQVLAPGARLTLDEITGFHQSPPAGFGLDQYGEQVVLSYLPGSGVDRIVDAVAFKAQEHSLSLGRYPEQSPWFHPLTPSRGAPNTTPLSNVIITELMYHPPDDADDDATASEYVEIYNPLAYKVNLWNATGPWRLDGGVQFNLPRGAALGAGASALIVGFDPADAAALNRFLARYHLSKGAVTIWGPYRGALSNRSERVALEKPMGPELPEDPLGWMILDELIYADAAPFPAAADGGGFSLQRRTRTGHGSDPANWSAAAPTPGTVRFVSSSAPGKAALAPAAWTGYE